MQKRHRFKQSTSLQDRLASFAKQASEKATKLPPGPERENLLRKAHQAETASRVEEWVADRDQHAPHPEIASFTERRGQP